MTPTPADVRNASHVLAQVSGMLRNEAPPQPREWERLRSLFKADDVLAVSNWLIERAKNMEAREQAA